jgi:dCTP deaminase
MGIMPDKWLIENGEKIIKPFHAGQVAKGQISFGVSSYGYDIRVANEFKIFTNVRNAIVDPKNFTNDSFVEYDASETGYCILPPNSFLLCRSLEWIEVPRDMLILVIGKSTYARCGLILNCTPLEPEWKGHITLEISNTTTLPAKIYANEGIGQLLFFKGEGVCDVSYADRKGKYQNQVGVVLPKVLRP